MPTHEAHLQPFLVSYTVCADWSYVRLLKLNYQPGTTSALIKYTRIHSGKMRTARLLTLSRSIRWGGLPTPRRQTIPRGRPSPGCRAPPTPPGGRLQTLVCLFGCIYQSVKISHRYHLPERGFCLSFIGSIILNVNRSEPSLWSV